MDRRVSIVAAALLALLSSGACQGYNFNPVGHCLIQPGTKRVTLSTISTADVLFVVDDSGSMLGEQASLATNFQQFIDTLNQANADRVANGLDPIDFHIAITTTSMFRSPDIGSVCKNSCTGAVGSKVCCLSNGTPQAPYCRSNGDCATGYTCRTSAECGAAVAIGGQGCFDAACNPQQIACDTIDAECSNVQHFYSTFTGCTAGYADNRFTDSDEYPMGRFMAPVGNPLVLHFDKDLYCNWDAATGQCNGGTVDTTAINALIADFGQNVAVGTCGSNQEQGIEAAHAAIARAEEAGGQPTGTGYTGLSDFLHPNAKLVVVWVTDEDDCSSPADPADAVAFFQLASTDACIEDAAKPQAQQRENSIAGYADFFTSRGRPFGAAFVASLTNGCADQSCQPAICCGTDGNVNACGATCTTAGSCGGQGLPNRYVALANELAGRGSDVVLGSVCDQFGTSLGRIAEIVKPPTGLPLPTLPADGAVTLVRIVGSDGVTRKTCYGPAPEAMDAAAAAAANYDWWFTATGEQTTAAQKDPVTVSKFIYINHQTANCEANPGETYSADYIGQLPAAGATSPGGCLTDAECSDALGGSAGDWTCFAGQVTQFVTVGTNVSATSPSGTAWTSQTIPAGAYRAVTWTGTQYVAVGTSVAATSPDGVTWTSRTIPAGDYAGVAASGSQIVAVGTNVAASSEDGITWATRTIPAGSYAAVVRWSNPSTQEDRFVAVGTNVAATSSDGNTWTARAIPAGSYTGLARNGTRLAAVGASVAASSDDGYTWTTRTIPAGSYAAVAGNGARFVAVGANVVATSDDGISWVARSLPAGTYRGVGVADGQWVAVGTNVAASSVDGAAWTSRTISAGDYAAASGVKNVCTTPVSSRRGTCVCGARADICAGSLP